LIISADFWEILLKNQQEVFEYSSAQPAVVEAEATCSLMIFSSS
jgi:hypothetical protein